MVRDRQGKVVQKMLFIRRDRNRPGFVLVNKAGKRFISEAEPYNDVAHAMNATPGAVPATWPSASKMHRVVSARTSSNGTSAGTEICFDHGRIVADALG